MTAKDRILTENQAEAARRLEELKATDSIADRHGNFTGMHEDRGESIIRTSTGELGTRDSEEIHGDPMKHRTPEQLTEAAEREAELERQMEKANRELEAER
jgi:hypothetical protein